MADEKIDSCFNRVVVYNLILQYSWKHIDILTKDAMTL